MGNYTLIISKDAQKEITYFYKLGDKAIIRKLEKILQELIDHPTKGTGKVEQLRGDLAGCWSRRLNKKHRIVYEVNESIVTVFVVSASGRVAVIHTTSPFKKNNPAPNQIFITT